MNIGGFSRIVGRNGSSRVMILCSWIVLAALFAAHLDGQVQTLYVSPSGGNFASVNLQMGYSDAYGYNFIDRAWFDIYQDSFHPQCVGFYEQSSNSIWLMNDTQTAWLNVPLGSSAPLGNSQCSIDATRSWRGNTGGNELDVSFAFVFQGSFGGTKQITIRAEDFTHNVASDWGALGTWTVPSGQTVVWVDFPQPGSLITGAPYYVEGAAVDSTSLVNSVMISGPFSTQATYGQFRADICSLYSSWPGCITGSDNIGWIVQDPRYIDTSTWAQGAGETLTVSATTMDGR